MSASNGLRSMKLRRVDPKRTPQAKRRTLERKRIRELKSSAGTVSMNA